MLNEIQEKIGDVVEAYVGPRPKPQGSEGGLLYFEDDLKAAYDRLDYRDRLKLGADLLRFFNRLSSFFPDSRSLAKRLPFLAPVVLLLLLSACDIAPKKAKAEDLSKNSKSNQPTAQVDNADVVVPDDLEEEMENLKLAATPTPTPTPISTQEQPQPTETARTSIIVFKSTVNKRSGPGTGFGSKGVFSKDSPFDTKNIKEKVSANKSIDGRIWYYVEELSGNTLITFWFAEIPGSYLGFIDLSLISEKIDGIPVAPTRTPTHVAPTSTPQHVAPPVGIVPTPAPVEVIPPTTGFFFPNWSATDPNDSNHTISFGPSYNLIDGCESVWGDYGYQQRASVMTGPPIFQDNNLGFTSHETRIFSVVKVMQVLPLEGGRLQLTLDNKGLTPITAIINQNTEYTLGFKSDEGAQRWIEQNVRGILPGLVKQELIVGVILNGDNTIAYLWVNKR